MKEGFTDISNELLDAVLKFRCPGRFKEVILGIMELTNGYGEEKRGVSVLRLARYIGRDKWNTAKRLRILIQCKVVKETVSFTRTEARHLKINSNYREWQLVKGQKDSKAEKSRKQAQECILVMPEV